MRKRADISAFGGFTIYCDELPSSGGVNTAPLPLYDFAASILFCEMTQIGRYSHLMKVNITKVRAHVAIHFDLRGSVLAQTIQAGCPTVVTNYDIESPDDQARVAAVLHNARNGCWVRVAVTNPVPFEDSITLNGQVFSIDAFPRRETE